MKKILCIAAIAVLTLLACSSLAFAAAPTLSLVSEDGGVGEDISVQVELTGNPGVKSAAFLLCYDNRYLQPVSCSSSFGGQTAYNLRNQTEDGEAAVSFSLISPVVLTGDGVVATMRFRIVGQPASGVTALEFARFGGNRYLTGNNQETILPDFDASDAVRISGGSVIPVTDLVLNQSELVIEKGASATLTATVFPANATNQAINWSSSQEEIVTVADGNVLGRSEGYAIVTASSADGNYVAICSVTVGNPPVRVTGIRLDRSSLTLGAKEKAVLNATITPASASETGVIWKSSDETVATVTGGLVIAKGNGSAVITAVAKDGGYSAACKVTVSGYVETVEATGIAVNPGTLSLTAGDLAVVKCSAQPAEATTDQSVVWSSSDSSVAEVADNGIVSAVGEGSAVIRATSCDHGFTAVCNVRVAAPVEEDSEEDQDEDAESSEDADIFVRPAGMGNFRLANQAFPFLDVATVPGDWVYEAVNSAYQLGLMKGDARNLFLPEGDYQVSEALMTAARLHNIYYGGDGEIQQPKVWYEGAVEYCLKYEIIAPGDFDSYTRNITRGEMAYVFANALPDQTLPPINAIMTLPDVAEGQLYGAEIYRLYRAGVLTGNDAFGTYRPNDRITRREAAAIISRMALVSQRQLLSY